MQHNRHHPQAEHKEEGRPEPPQRPQTRAQEEPHLQHIQRRGGGRLRGNKAAQVRHTVQAYPSHAQQQVLQVGAQEATEQRQEEEKR